MTTVTFTTDDFTLSKDGTLTFKLAPDTREAMMQMHLFAKYTITITDSWPDNYLKPDPDEPPAPAPQPPQPEPTARAKMARDLVAGDVVVDYRYATDSHIPLKVQSTYISGISVKTVTVSFTNGWNDTVPADKEYELVTEACRATLGGAE